MTKDDVKKLQAELDEVSTMYANGLVHITEKLERQVALVDLARNGYLLDSLSRLNQVNPNPNDYDKAQQLLLAHRSFDRGVDKLNFAI